MADTVCQQTALFLSGINGDAALALILILLFGMLFLPTEAIFSDEGFLEGPSPSARYSSRDDVYIHKLTSRLLRQTAAVTLGFPLLSFIACLCINAFIFCGSGSEGERFEYPSALEHMFWVLVPSYIMWAAAVVAWVKTLCEVLGGDQTTWDSWEGYVHFMLCPAEPIVVFLYQYAYGVAHALVLRGAERAQAKRQQGVDRSNDEQAPSVPETAKFKERYLIPAQRSW